MYERLMGEVYKKVDIDFININAGVDPLAVKPEPFAGGKFWAR